MTSPCDSTRHWLALQGTGEPVDVITSAKAAAHLRACPACQQLQQRMAALEEQANLAFDYVPEPAVEEAFRRLAQLRAIPSQELAAHWEGDLSESLRSKETAEGAFVAQAVQQQKAESTQLSSPRLGLLGTLGLVAAALLMILLQWGGGVGDTQISPSEQSQPPVEIFAATPPNPVPMTPARDEATGVERPVDDPASARRQDRTVQGTVAVAARRETAKVASPVAMRPQKGLLRASDKPLQRSDEDVAEITLQPRSDLWVDAWSVSDTRLVLERGTVFADVVHRKEGEHFQITTPNARIVVVGTVFSVSYSPEQGTQVDGTSGRVRVESLDGRVVGYVGAGERLHVTPADLDLREEVRRMLAEGQAEEAIGLMTADAAIDWSTDPLLADAHLLAGELGKAEAIYRAALAAQPRASVYLDLARLMDHQDRAEEAAEVWGDYLSAYPEGRYIHEALWALGEFARQETRHEQAKRHYAALASLERGRSDEAFAHVTAILLSQERWDEAEAWLLPYEMDGGSRGEVALVGLARVELAQGEKRRALRRLGTYELRFGRGARREEVDRLKQAGRTAP